MANNMRLSLILSAKDRLSSVVRTSVFKSEKAFDRFEKKIDSVSGKFNDIGKRSLAAGAAMVGAGVLMLKSTADFESSMASVSTLIDTNKESLANMNKEVLQIAKKTPVALDQLTGALYDIRSAGISASDQFNVLEKSSQLGVAGLGSTKEAVDLVTSSINAFKLTGEAQNKLYDNIFKTIKTGKTTISQLAQGFGAVAGTVAAAGINIDDYLASVAALTTTGQPAAQAHTQMKAAIAGLTRNTKEQQKIFRTLGARDFNDLIKKSGSVVGAFSGINRVVKGNKAKLIELLGSVEAYNAVLSLTGNQNKAYADTIHEMRYGADAFSEAYQKKLITVNAQLQRGRNIIQKIGIDLGTYLVPPFSKFLNSVELVMNKVDAMPESMKRFIALGTVGAGIGLIAFGGISLAIGSAVKSIGALAKAYRITALFMRKHRFMAEIKAIRAVGLAFRSVGLAIAATPIGWIVAGVAALAVAGLLVYKYWKPLKAFFGGFAEGLKTSLKPTIDEIRTALKPLQPLIGKIGHALSAFGGWIMNFIQPVNTAGEKSRSWGVAVGKAAGALIKCVFGISKFLIKSIPFITITTAIYKNFDRIKSSVGGAADKLGQFTERFRKNKDIKVSASASVSTPPKIDGSHADGLSFVPRDGYIAELHKGERVLTADENRQLVSSYTMMQNQPVSYVFNPVIYAGNSDIKEIEAIIERKQREFFNKIETEKRRKEARAYA